MHTFQNHFSYLGDLSLILSVSKTIIAKLQGMIDISMYVGCTVDKSVSQCTVPRYHAGHVCTCHEGSLGHPARVNQQLNALLHLQVITHKYHNIEHTCYNIVEIMSSML